MDAPDGPAAHRDALDDYLGHPWAAADRYPEPEEDDERVERDTAGP